MAGHPRPWLWPEDRISTFPTPLSLQNQSLEADPALPVEQVWSDSWFLPLIETKNLVNSTRLAWNEQVNHQNPHMRLDTGN